MKKNHLTLNQQCWLKKFYLFPFHFEVKIKNEKERHFSYLDQFDHFSRWQVSLQMNHLLLLTIIKIWKEKKYIYIIEFCDTIIFFRNHFFSEIPNFVDVKFYTFVPYNDVFEALCTVNAVTMAPVNNEFIIRLMIIHSIANSRARVRSGAKSPYLK